MEGGSSRRDARVRGRAREDGPLRAAPRESPFAGRFVRRPEQETFTWMPVTGPTMQVLRM